VLDRKGKGKPDKSGELYTSYSNVGWKDVQEVFNKYIVSYVQLSKSVPMDDLDVLYGCVRSVRKTFGSPTAGNEAKRLYFIAPILVCVCLLLKDVEIEVEESMKGNRIRANGQFEFVLRRGDNRVCIAEAKTNDIEKGLAQALMGCETIADVESVDCVHCIVTNFLVWNFVNSKDDVIELHETQMQLIDGIPTRTSLGEIVGKICALLC